MAPAGSGVFAGTPRRRPRRVGWVHHSLEDLRKVGVRLREADGRLGVLPRVESPYGIPPRPRRPPAVRLVPGQWVRWQLNYRFSSLAGMQDWSYWLDTFNIAYGPAEADVFLSEPPIHVDERGPLR